MNDDYSPYPDLLTDEEVQRAIDGGWTPDQTLDEAMALARPGWGARTAVGSEGGLLPEHLRPQVDDRSVEYFGEDGGLLASDSGGVNLLPMSSEKTDSASVPMRNTSSKGSTEWIPADPERTRRFICEGLKNGGHIDRDDPKHKNDLSWRDAEHALFAYTSTRDNPALFLPAHFWVDPIYSALKIAGGPILRRISPETSPGSVGEALAGVNGAFRGMDAAVGKDNPFQCP